MYVHALKDLVTEKKLMYILTKQRHLYDYMVFENIHI